MKIFGWKSTGRAFARPAKTRVSLARTYGTYSLGEWPRSYEQQVREGYLHNAIAQRAVRLVADGVAAAPLTASDPVALALVKATSGGQALIETVAAHLLLHGNAYIELLPGPDGCPCELYALRPERVVVEADPRGWPVAFVYRAGEAATRMPADCVIHIRNMHPLDDHYGLGCLGAASGAVAIHNAAAKWNKALLDNAARPSGALVYEPGEGSPLSGEQYDRLKEELAASFQGSGNAGRPMLLEGGLKWQAMSMTPADMDFVGLKEGAAREIALAFGVPPVLLGLPGDATYSNYREANKALWQQAILPLAGKILEALSQGLRPWFADLALGLDLDAIPALSEDRERLWAQVSGAEFLTLNEKRQAVGLSEIEEPEEVADPPDERNSGKLEFKFNPWHDGQNGQFTFSNQGQRFGGGGASGSWDKKPQKNPGVTSGASASRDGSKPKPGGGSFGGGGASGSWDKPEPAKPNLQVQQPKRETVTPLRVRVVDVAPKLHPKTVTKKISAGGYHFESDAQDRTIRAYGDLRLQPDQRRSKPEQSNAGKPDRMPTDHGGHFIAREFGGPEIRYNHFAQNARFNTSDYRKLENDWKKYLKAGKKVRVDIGATYLGNSKRPHEIHVQYFVNGKRSQRSFPNAK